ncbi:glycoprotein 16 [Alphabaculovirus altersperidaniae]|uniref:Glycoprotein 16 n=1 Tax=Spodoptera eridania nucleopolyhedrovirus TaxID=2315721 RepID=A0ABX6TQ55_9ABAC|nr:glycoprotein 16 [Spodoptera eridania nucleopolyhedrovirus]QNV47853.1 glycoprotein 16 [Spodoptera eridania nucleopolyhedrovirus]
MNYSAIALVLLTTYLWYANSMTGEIAIVKKLLLLIYEKLQANFDNVTSVMTEYHDSVMLNLSKLHNMTKHSVDLILINSKKIDVINNKIDTLLESS